MKMELGFVESMRRRWEVLGIRLDSKGKGKGKGKGREEEREEVVVGEEGEDGMDVDEKREKVQEEKIVVEGEEDESDAARQAIMDGMIVKSVISSAVKGLSVSPTPILFPITFIHHTH